MYLKSFEPRIISMLTKINSLNKYFSMHESIFKFKDGLRLRIKNIYLMRQSNFVLRFASTWNSSRRHISLVLLHRVHLQSVCKWVTISLCDQQTCSCRCRRLYPIIVCCITQVTLKHKQHISRLDFLHIKVFI